MANEEQLAILSKVSRCGINGEMKIRPFDNRSQWSRSQRVNLLTSIIFSKADLQKSRFTLTSRDAIFAEQIQFANFQGS